VAFMIGVGAVLLVLALIFAVAVVVSNAGDPTLNAEGLLDFSIFGARISATVPGVFFTGAVMMLVLLVALLLLFVGLRRARGQRKRIKSLQKSAAAVEKERGSTTDSPPRSRRGRAKSAAADSDDATTTDSPPPTTSPAASPARASAETGADERLTNSAVSSRKPGDAAGETTETTPEERSRLLDEVDRAAGSDDDPKA
jgi:cytoskeletal protein RodZ